MKTPYHVLVFDIETTGLDGVEAGDKVVEIGVATANLSRGTVTPLFTTVIKDYISIEERDAWIFKNSDLTINEVANSPYNRFAAARIVRELAKHKHITSYNTDFDFNRFLFKSPWNLDDTTVQAPDIMLQAANVPGITKGHAGGTRYPTLKAAYDMLCPDDPAGIKDGQHHRALSDAMAAGYVLLSLNDKGLYFEGGR